VFAGAAVSTHAPSGLPTADQLFRQTVELLLQEPVVAFSPPAVRRIREALTTERRLDLVPLEALYDAMEQVAGMRMFVSVQGVS
jgi:hypothetical protein